MLPNNQARKAEANKGELARSAKVVAAAVFVIDSVKANWVSVNSRD